MFSRPILPLSALATLLMSCSIHSNHFSSNPVAYPAVAPESISITRFDYTIEALEPPFTDTGSSFSDDDVYLDEGAYDEEGQIYSDVLYTDDARKAMDAINVTKAAVELYRDIQHAESARRELGPANASANRGYLESAEPAFVAEDPTGQLQQHYLQAYALLEQHLQTELELPILPIDSAIGFAPYDINGFPYGRIDGRVLPEDIDAALAVAIDIDYGSPAVRQFNNEAEAIWQPKVTVYLEMKDRNNQTLWAERVHHRPAAAQTHYYRRDAYGAMQLVRRAGPDMKRELQVALKQISLTH